MEDRHISVPEQKNYEQAFQLAHQFAREKLAAIPDIEEQCRRSGTQYQQAADKKMVVIRYLNQPYFLSVPDAKISPAEDADPITKRDGLIMLHYFLSAKGTPPTGRLITFRELPEGSVYQPTFAKRTIQPLLQNFGKEPDNLLLYSLQMGGYKSDYGDMGVTINAFSRVPVTFVIWQGDDEFPSQGNVLFDANISDYLPTEDITVLCEIITWRLIRFSRA
ncbi:MAG: DUF3786 domain-containing protein [Chloroflexi bacterium]|nr:DUF3786 domain-containing protein [Chloroflexota bacterium]